MDDLGINLGVKLEGPAYARGRALGEADLLMLDAAQAQAPQLRRLTQRHHALARMIAGGAPAAEAAISCDYTPTRVAQLQRDPTFRELIAFYSKKVDEVFVDRARALSDLSTDAILELHARLEDTPEAFSVRDLTELSKVALDRTGLGPSTTQVNVNVDIAARMAAARARLAGESKAPEEVS